MTKKPSKKFMEAMLENSQALNTLVALKAEKNIRGRTLRSSPGFLGLFSFPHIERRELPLMDHVEKYLEAQYDKSATAMDKEWEKLKEIH